MRSFFKKGKILGFLFSPIFLILGASILALTFSSYIKIILQKAAIQKEISNLRSEKEKLEANNKDLASLLDYFASESYKEREARLKLNLQKSGEQVIIISQEEDAVSGNDSKKDNQNSSDVPNFKKWWDYFFKNK